MGEQVETNTIISHAAMVNAAPKREATMTANGAPKLIAPFPFVPEPVGAGPAPLEVPCGPEVWAVPLDPPEAEA